MKAVQLIKREGRITNKMYREALEVTDRTALRDLKELMALGLLDRMGETGQHTFYVLKVSTRHKPDTENGANPT